MASRGKQTGESGEMRAPPEQLAVRSHDSCLTLQAMAEKPPRITAYGRAHGDFSGSTLHPQTAKTGVLANRRGLEATAHSFLLDPDHTHNPNH
ncbi:hypothetical protein D623_10024121 [Myotis brandtii]|uniref:Uncharacterized protein n=1 Tax=Myotis brandtii TaxID=109478 RepID=S7NF50_MYOBR|nr:hypothetical protein D623_10024121 [Myotis brandtii]